MSLQYSFLKLWMISKVTPSLQTKFRIPRNIKIEGIKTIKNPANEIVIVKDLDWESKSWNWLCKLNFVLLTIKSYEGFKSEANFLY